MSEAYDQYQNLTLKEKVYIKRYPSHILIIKETKEKAFKQTKKLFGFNGHNDKSDAFRHCYWSALLSKEIGYANALVFTTAHESSPLNPKNEKSMDLHNNLFGLKIGLHKKSDSMMSMQCIMALKKGQLKVIRP